MILKVADNLVVNTEQVLYIHSNVIKFTNGEEYRLDKISMRNIHRICECNEVILFNGMNKGVRDESD